MVPGFMSHNDILLAVYRVSWLAYDGSSSTNIGGEGDRQQHHRSRSSDYIVNHADILYASPTLTVHGTKMPDLYWFIL